MVHVGQHVRITGLTARGRTGTVLEELTVLGQKRFRIVLDRPFMGRDQLIVPWRRLTSQAKASDEFEAGDRVTFANRLLRGWTGTLVRPTHLLWKRAWLVQMDGSGVGIKRTRVTERALVLLDESRPRPAEE
jgi:hypothetical protein